MKNTRRDKNKEREGGKEKNTKEKKRIGKERDGKKYKGKRKTRKKRKEKKRKREQGGRMKVNKKFRKGREEKKTTVKRKGRKRKEGEDNVAREALYKLRCAALENLPGGLHEWCTSSFSLVINFGVVLEKQLNHSHMAYINNIADKTLFVR